jgi:hypothetical protein
MMPKTNPVHSVHRDARHFPWASFAALSLFALPLIALADLKPVATFDQDVQAFAISQDNHIIYAVQRMKRGARRFLGGRYRRQAQEDN